MARGRSSKGGKASLQPVSSVGGKFKSSAKIINSGSANAQRSAINTLRGSTGKGISSSQMPVSSILVPKFRGTGTQGSPITGHK